MVNFFRFISRENCFRLGLFLALLAAAWVFDRTHEPVVQEKPSAANEQDMGSPGLFVCTFQGQVSLKAPVEKNVHSRVVQEHWNRLLVAQLKARMAHLRTALNREEPRALPEIRHLMIHRFYHYVNPDDLPPLS